MITAAQARELRRLVKALADAQEALSWAGGGNPVDTPTIEAEYRAASAEFKGYLDSLTLAETPDLSALKGPRLPMEAFARQLEDGKWRFGVSYASAMWAAASASRYEVEVRALGIRWMPLPEPYTRSPRHQYRVRLRREHVQAPFR